MKALNSWVAAVVACSAIAGQANADVLMFGSEDNARDVSPVANLKTFDGVGNVPAANSQQSHSERPVFVPGSLIDKSGQGAWLMSQTARLEKAAQSHKVSPIQFASLGHGITPIPPAGTETRPISTFAQFVQVFKSSPVSHQDSDAVLAMVGEEEEIVPKTSNMTLIGLFTFSLAGITAVITASRRGYFGRTPRQRRARMF